MKNFAMMIRDGKRFSFGPAALLVALVLGMATPAAATKEATPPDNVTLSTLGASTAIALYNAHLIIGLSAEARTHGASDTQVFRLLLEQRNMVGVLDGYLQSMEESAALEAGDRRTIAGLRQCITNILAFAGALQELVQTPGPELAERFENRRLRSYSSIARIMGLPDATPPPPARETKP